MNLIFLILDVFDSADDKPVFILEQFILSARFFESRILMTGVGCGQSTC